MSDHTIQSVLSAIGAPAGCTIAQAIGATGAHSEDALVAWFGEGYSAYFAHDSSRGGRSDDPDVNRARTAGYEAAMLGGE